MEAPRSPHGRQRELSRFPVMDLVPESEFGRYRIRRLLGRGGMGAVYEAVHIELGKRVALKTLAGTLGAREDARARFLREARAAARLDHPHVVGVSDVGIVDDVPFLIMEYLEGEDLHQLLEREGALPMPRIVEIVLPIAWALAAAHELKIVHRDIKPQNVFLAQTKQGRVAPKLLDFGISKLSDAEGPTGLTGSMSLLGTPSYMSPEQVRGAKHVDARSDQYSLGVLLYECATGRLPFEETELYPLLNAISTGARRPLDAVRPGLPRPFVAAVERAMATNPEERHVSMLDFGSALLPLAAPEVEAAWRASFRGSTGTLPASMAVPPGPPRGTETSGAGEAPSIDALAATVSRGKRASAGKRAVLGAGVALAGAASAWHFGVGSSASELKPRETAAFSAGAVTQVPLAAPAPNTSESGRAASSVKAADAVFDTANGVVPEATAPNPAARNATAPNPAARTGAVSNPTARNPAAPPRASSAAPLPAAPPFKPSRRTARSESESVASPSVRPTPAAVPTNQHPISTPNNAPILE